MNQFSRLLLFGNVLVQLGFGAIRPMPDSMTNAILHPFWATNLVRGESVLFLRSNAGDTPRATLLFTPLQILEVRRVDGKVIYNAGTDYQISGRGLLAPVGSKITNKLLSDFYINSNSYDPVTNKYWQKSLVGDPQTWIYYKEADFTNMQVEVDYIRAESWTGYSPQFEGSRLPKIAAKLKNKQPVKIAYLGDSITAGANASGTAAPFTPKWAEGFADMLQKTYGSPIEISNLGVGGSWANSMTNGKTALVIGYAPGLTVIAFGMNDVNGNFPNTYKNNIQAAVNEVRASLPGMEFILVSSCLANPEWNWTPATNFPLYASALSTLVGPGIALADMTALWTGLMANKRYLDLTGNGINHPNDYGHRNYAAVLFNMLWDTNTVAVGTTNAPPPVSTRSKIRSLTPKLVFSPTTGLSIGLDLLPTARVVEIHVYALHGALVKKMTDPSTGLNTSQFSAFWDGRGKTGQALPTGTYVLLLYVDGVQADYRTIVLSNP